MAEQAGFEALYLSGASIAYTRLGRSDVGLTTATEVAETLALITERVRLPVIVDADTGFGNALNTQRTVREFERAGAAMIQIEDQAFPKRCGHLDGKSVVPVARDAAASCARRWTRGASRDTLILARTDALAVEGLDAALERAERYLECGVDALFIEALRTPAADGRGLRPLRRSACRCWPTWSKAGKTPVQSADELGAAGLSHRDLSRRHGARRRRTRCRAITRACTQHGTTAPWRDRMLDFDGLNRLIGTPELLEAAERYKG